MKKRMVSMLLTVCMVMVLFSGVSAYAAGDTITHTLQKGETVYGICQTLGIDFYANYKWITDTNKITNYANLKVGTVLTLPAPGTVPGKAPSVTGSTPAAGSTSSKGLRGGDFVSGYLIPHVMQRGETVYNVCAALGIDFNANSDTIMKLNNIKNYNRIFVGRSILLPTAKAPADGSFYKIVAHKIVKGDSAFAICNGYGIDFASNTKLLETINKSNNLGVIKTGQLFYLPIPTTAAAEAGGNGGGSNGGNGGNGGGSAATPGGGSSGGTQADGQVYKIYTDSSKNGSFEIQVNGKTVTEAKSGTVVTVKTNPNHDCKVGNISVTNSGKSVASVSNGRFTMPNCDVRINVSFVSGKDYSVFRGATQFGTFETLVNGKAVDKAAAGSTVTVNPKANYGYEIDKISVTYNEGKNSVAVSNNSFVMPAHTVLVKVSFKELQTHTITLGSHANGSVEFKINGNAVTKANYGDKITVAVTPDKGYSLSKITVKSGSDSFDATGGSFTMPQHDVTVDVSFVAHHTVTVKPASNGSVSTDRDGAIAGETVTITLKPNKAAELGEVSVTDGGGNAVKLSGTGNTRSFVMPDSDVTVSASFISVETYTIFKGRTQNGVFSFTVNNKPVDSAQAGELVKVEVEPDYDYVLDTVTVTYNEGANTVTVNADNSFVMPSHTVKVDVSFKAA